MKKLCVFCGSSTKVSKKFLLLAKRLGKELVKNDIDLVYGAGSIGMMGVLADSVLEAKGNVYGVIPEFMIPWEVVHKNLTELVIFSTMHERKQEMYDLADAFLALPGGIGTMDELCEILTWGQLEIHKKPIWILNYEGFYDNLIEHFNVLVKKKFFSREHLKLINISDDMLKIIKELKKS